LIKTSTENAQFRSAILSFIQLTTLSECLVRTGTQIKMIAFGGTFNHCVIWSSKTRV